MQDRSDAKEKRHSEEKEFPTVQHVMPTSLEDLEVFVVGGGDSAVEEAMYLTKFARKVTIIHRRNELRAAKSIQEKAFANPKIEFFWDSVVEEVGGDDILQWMKVKNVKTGEVKTVEADEEDGMFGVFGFIGTVPNSKYL